MSFRVGRPAQHLHYVVELRSSGQTPKASFLQLNRAQSFRKVGQIGCRYLSLDNATFGVYLVRLLHWIANRGSRLSLYLSKR